MGDLCINFKHVCQCLLSISLIRNLEVKAIIIWIYSLFSFPFLDLSSLNVNQWSKVDVERRKTVYFFSWFNFSLLFSVVSIQQLFDLAELTFFSCGNWAKRPSISILNEWLMRIDFWPLPAPSKKKKSWLLLPQYFIMWQHLGIGY